MREKVFRLVLGALERNTPPLVRSVEIQLLLNLTARGFGVAGECVWIRSPEGALSAYRDFSLRCMSGGQRNGERLFRHAYRTGERIRRLTGFTAQEDLRRLVFYLYRNLDIHMTGLIPGTITVTDCSFSRHYTPQQCEMMSHADAGLIAGVQGGGRLRFTQRLTQGCGCCTACFTGGADR